MTGLAVALILASCLLHAVWNLLVKRARDKDAFTVIYLLAASVLYLPLMAVFAAGRPIPPAGWGCILSSGFLYGAYFLALARAYRHGDLSFAYPVARGLGPLLAAVVGVGLMGERITVPGGVGIALILLAVAVLQIPLARVRSGESGVGAFTANGALAGKSGVHRGRRISPALGWAILVGAIYAAYSIVDKTAVGRVGVHPVVYIYLAYATSALVVTPAVAMRSGIASIIGEWRQNGGAAVAVGCLNVGAYVLVLFAMAMPGSPVSYVVPLRTASVLFGVLGGVGLLGEHGARSRIAAAFMVMTGVALIAWKG